MRAFVYQSETGETEGANGFFLVGPDGITDHGSPSAGLHDVTPADADLPAGPCRSLLVTVAGNLAIKCSDGSEPTAFPVVAGQTIPTSVIRVKAATTATVKAFYGYAPVPAGSEEG